MEHLGDTGHVESCFGPFGDGVSVGARHVTVCAKRTIGSEAVLDAPMVTSLKCKLISVCLEIVLVLTQIGARFVPNVP